MSNKLCLQWNDFQENSKAAFENLRDDKNFTDVTLVSEDGEHLEAHKVILAASSLFFKKILESSYKHPHPLLFMRGLDSANLTALVDFLYFGEVKVHQENLDSFMTVAGELQIKGLMENSIKYNEKTVPNTKFETSAEKISKTSGVFQSGPKPIKNTNPSELSTFFAEDLEELDPRLTSMMEQSQNTVEVTKIKIEALPSKSMKTKSGSPSGQESTEDAREYNENERTTFFAGNLKDLDLRLTSMMEQSEITLADGVKKVYRCKICSKEGLNGNIKEHIEVHHLPEIVLQCSVCEKTFNYRRGLRNHICKTTKFHLIV